MLNYIIREDVESILKMPEFQKCRGKTFLITGATGAIARYFVYTLLEWNRKYVSARCKVVAICRNTAKAKELFEEYGPEELTIIEQPVEREIQYDGEVHFMIHAASNSATRLFYSNPVETASANLVGTVNLLNLAREKNVEAFLFLSSGAVYGDDSQAVADVRENEYYSIDALDIGNSYALSKKMAENLCVSYCSEHEVPAKIVRIAHTYGPGIDLEDGHIYSDFVKSFLDHRDIVIRGSGVQKRAFCYITDAMRAFFLILFHGEPGQAYNMANNSQFMSIKELAERLVEGIEREKKIIIQEKETETEAVQVSICAEKLEQLGWKPSIGVVEGFQRTIESKQEESITHG